MTDVLVIGGGPAGTWAAVAAARAGASVVLADKGLCGTSGSAAAGGNNVWSVPPGPARQDAVAHRERTAGGLTDRGWMGRTLDETWRRFDDLAAWGYPFPLDVDALAAAGTLGAYRRTVGWGGGRTPGSRADANHVFTARLRGQP